jgi:hypothetical protein
MGASDLFHPPVYRIHLTNAIAHGGRSWHIEAFQLHYFADLSLRNIECWTWIVYSDFWPSRQFHERQILAERGSLLLRETRKCLWVDQNRGYIVCSLDLCHGRIFDANKIHWLLRIYRKDKLRPLKLRHQARRIDWSGCHLRRWGLRGQHRRENPEARLSVWVDVIVDESWRIQLNSSRSRHKSPRSRANQNCQCIQTERWYWRESS